MKLPTLRYGAKGEHVKTLQRLLMAAGCFEGYVGGNFKKLTLAAVRYFQQTHIGKNGLFLKVDGVVGPKTWWALQNQNGPPQKSGLHPVIPKGLSTKRQEVLSLCVSEYQKKIAEKPNGSNWGDGVTKYLIGIGAAPWCCFFVSWIWKNALGNYPMNKRHGHCLTMWREARSRGKAHYKADYEPIPGDIFIMLYRTSNGNLSGSGHTGIVSNVAKGGQAFNSFGGNEGNRLKHGYRQESQSTLVGFINLLDHDHKFEHRIVTNAKIDSSVGGTR